jgi:hypothetical protein
MARDPSESDKEVIYALQMEKVIQQAMEVTRCGSPEELVMKIQGMIRSENMMEPQWIGCPPAPEGYIKSLSLLLKTSQENADILAIPRNIYMLQNEVGVERITEIKTRSNKSLTKCYIGKPVQALCGNSRARDFINVNRRFDKIEAQGSAKLCHILPQVNKIASTDPNTLHVCYIVDPICNITQLSPSSRELSVQDTTAIQITKEMEELKQKAPKNAVIIYATIITPDIKKHNKVKAQRHKQSQRLRAREPENIVTMRQSRLTKIVQEVNAAIPSMNGNYETPRLDQITRTRDGVHLDKEGLLEMREILETAISHNNHI